MFTVFSAYGTTGLATIDVGLLRNGSKIILIIVMFIGQLGVLNFLKAFSPQEGKDKANKRGVLIKEYVQVG